ncbi:MAG: hypothetical protein ACTSUE_02465 [Promethearchaeota archaeon]
MSLLDYQKNIRQNEGQKVVGRVCQFVLIVLIILVFYFDVFIGDEFLGVPGASVVSFSIFLIILISILLRNPELLSKIINISKKMVLGQFWELFVMGGLYLALIFIIPFFHLGEEIWWFIASIPIFPYYIISISFQLFTTQIISTLFGIILGLPLTIVLLFFLLKRYFLKKKINFEYIKDEADIFNDIEQEPNSFEIHLRDKFTLNFSRFKYIILAINGFLMLMMFVHGVPGFDTPGYLYLARRFIEGSFDQRMDIILSEKFFALPTILMFSLLSGFSSNNLIFSASIYSILISVLSCYLYMKVIQKLFHSEKMTILSGLFLSFAPFQVKNFIELYKQGFALVMLLLSLFFLLKFIENRKKIGFKKYFFIISAILLNLVSLIYYFFLILEFIYIFTIAIIFIKGKKDFIKIFSLFLVLSIGIYIGFTYFSHFFIIKFANEFIQFQIINQENFKPFYNFQFLSKFSVYLILFPFSIIGFCLILQRIVDNKRKSNKSEGFGKYLLIFLMQGVVFILSPIFGLFGDSTRFIELFGFIIIIFSILGVLWFIQVLEKTRTSRKRKNFQKNLFIISLIACLFLNYALSYNALTRGTLSGKERDGLVYTKGTYGDFSQYENSSIILNSHLKYWSLYLLNLSEDSNFVYPYLVMDLAFKPSPGDVPAIIGRTTTEILSLINNLLNVVNKDDIFFIWSKIHEFYQEFYGNFTLDLFKSIIDNSSFTYSLIFDNEDVQILYIS